MKTRLLALCCSVCVLATATAAFGQTTYDTTGTTTITSATTTAGINLGVSNPDVTVTVDGNLGGSLTNTATITLGNVTPATGAALIINNAPWLQSIGSGQNVNLSGTNASITLQNGAALTTTGTGATFYLGSNANNSSNVPSSFTITGAGTSFTNGNSSQYANMWFGGHHTFTVSNGGTYTSTRSGYSFQLTGRAGVWKTDNNALIVTGANSTFNVNGFLRVSYDDNLNNSVTVSAGGVMNTVGANIGKLAGAIGNSATVTGSGSAWNLGGGAIDLGNNAGATDNSLNIRNGGALNNVGAITMNGTNNNFNLGDGNARSTATLNSIALGTSGAALNINNGKLTFLAAGIASITGSGTVNLQGPAYFSVGGTNSIDVAISGLGSLTKEGIGSLTLSGLNTYSGDTSVLAGTLSISAASLNDLADVYLYTASIFNLAYASTDTIRSFFIDGVAQDAGIWGSLGSGVAHETSRLTGSGLLNVTTAPVPEPGTLVLLFTGLAFAGFNWRKRLASSRN